MRANALLCLIHQANFLLDQQIIGLEQEFIAGGGYSEQLAAARIAQRDANPAAQDFPACPRCGKLMTLRTARHGSSPGQQFWGCTGFPACQGAHPL